jgi:antitoxin MazE
MRELRCFTKGVSSLSPFRLNGVADCIYYVDTSALAFGAIMRVIVRKWGNSASVRIPAAVLAAAELQLDQAVDIRGEDGRIIIEPIKPASYDIETLVSAITEDNRHESVTLGPPLGNEVW